MKQIGTYLIIALIALAVGAFISSKWFDNREPEIITKTKTEIVVKTKIDSIRIKFLEKELEKEKNNIKVETVILDLPDKKPMGEPVTRQVETQRYTGSDSLSNGTIDYTIYADSLRAVKFKLTTKDSIITKTIETTKILPAKSRLYLSGGLDVHPTPTAVSIGLMYNRRQKWGVGVEMRQDFSRLLPVENQTTFGVRVFIGL